MEEGIDSLTVDCYIIQKPNRPEWESAMDPRHRQRIEELYLSALQRSPELREDFLAAECRDDASLYLEVQDLIARDEEPSAILDRPAWERASGILKATELEAGTLLGPYRILRALGSGGMGTVYQAEDTRLRRKVAIKLLRSCAASKPGMRQRFKREAQAISALNHPHICALHDIGSQDGADYLVMEHLEGETLAARLRKGALPFPAAIAIAAQVADALGAAHGKGIVHRDLKPENIMLTAAGPKILDFGLAKVVAEPVVSGASTVTQTQPLTTKGSIIGTLPYMAPEQVEGRGCDNRTDIFAFGLVLYEMLAGRRAFAQNTKAGLIAAVIASDPDLGPIRTAANPQFERLLRGCLEKEPAKRWQSILDVKRLLEWPVEAPMADTGRRWLPWVLAAAAAASAWMIGAGYVHQAAEPAIPLRSSIDLADFDGGPAETPAVSPDGSQLAYLARDGAGVQSLRIRRFDKDSAAALPETDGAKSPFWSADGRWIGFLADGKLLKIRASGGRPQKIAEVSTLGNAAWSTTGDIVFSMGSRTPLYHVHESGGAPRQITKLDLSRRENSHRKPVFLPNGKQFLFIARCSDRGNDALYLGSLNSGKSAPMAAIHSNVEYVPARAEHPAALLYVRDGVLVSQGFEGKSLTGEPATVVDGVRYLTAGSLAAFTASADGRVLVYGSIAAGQSTLAWFDRSGRKVGELSPAGAYTQPRVSPDGSRVAFSQPDKRTGNRDIWTIEVAGGATSRLTSNPANDWFPVWSPDSKQILFGSDRQGGVGMKPFLKTALDAGVAETALEFGASLGEASPTDWSRTGWMAFNGFPQPGGRPDIWVMSAAKGKAFSFLGTEFSEGIPQFSPDGKWIAYVSNETGRSEVYIRPFREGSAGANDRIQVSTGGGDFPAWSKNGNELFFVSNDMNLKQVDLRHPGPIRSPGANTLFKVCPGTGLNALQGIGAVWEHPYDVAPDGRFLFNCLVEPPGRFVVWINWRAGALDGSG
jgi:serine/threonine protein kinase/Tol biopolymer transport system component